MEIRANEVESKKRVGKLNGQAVIEVGMRGGLWLVFAQRGGKFETLGAGPHRAVARFIAKKKQPDLEYTDLSKADWIDPAHFEFLLLRYEAMTEAIRARQGL